MLADANFPSASLCNGDEAPRLVRCDGHTIPQLLEAVLTLMPLDTYTFAPVCLMDLVNKDKNEGMGDPPVWSQYQQLLTMAEGRDVSMSRLER